MSKSNKTTPNVPTLRFKGFGQNWEHSTIGECSISLEYGMNAATIAYDGKHKYIRITDINEETSMFDPNPLSSPDGEFEEKYLVKENDILFARTGASVGKSYLYNTNDGELYFAGFLIRARIKAEYNGAFIYYQTKSKKYEKWVKLTSMRSGQPGINSQEYSSYSIAMTSKVEQDKIAEFLRIIDNRIAVQNKIISKYETLIKGITDSFFDIDGLYVRGDILSLKDVVSEGSKIPVNTSEYKKITIKLHNGGLEFADNSRIMADTRPFYVRNKNEIIIGKQNYFNGSIAIVGEEFDKTICSNAIMSFAVHTPYDINFIYFSLSNRKFLLRRSFLANGTGQKELSEKDFLNFTIRIPSIQEQKKISMIITSMQKRKNFEQSFLYKLQQQKHYLLNNMFI